MRVTRGDGHIASLFVINGLIYENGNGFCRYLRYGEPYHK